MDDNEQTDEIGPVPAGRTEAYPTLTYPAIVGGELEEPPDDAEDEWPDRGPAKGIRLAVPTAALLAALLVGGGFWAGAALQKSHASPGSSGGGSAASFLSRLRAAGGASGATGTGTTGTTGASGAGAFGLGSSAAATGTISVVDGKVLYVLTTSGALVKVTLGPSTAITRNAKSTPIDLRPGDTVVVQGATAANGNVSAASVSATAPGVSSGGGFGGGGRFGGFGGSGSTSATTSG